MQILGIGVDIVEKNRKNYSIIESKLLEIKGLKLRKIPSKCKPLCDTLIIQFDSKNTANKFVEKLQRKGFSTKNVPDAIEWHFAKYWGHMLKEIEVTLKNLQSNLKRTSDIIECCVALPIMVKPNFYQMNQQSNDIKKIVIESIK